MRKIFAILMALSLLSMSGCRSPDAQKPPTPTVATEKSISQVTAHDTEKTAITEAVVSTVTVSGTEKATESTTAATTVSAETKKSQSTKPTQAKQTESPSVPTTQKEQSQPTEASKPNATAADSKIIAETICDVINEYRLQQGSCELIFLPGLSAYAEYRSRQLISNFAHDTDDERAAATALRYGMYVEPALYGMTGDAYYTACAGEAIAKAGYTGTPESIARSFATLTKNSASHWSYVGSNDYRYIGVGVTYESGMWYCDIAVARENSDEK